jgi:hypothetical protein
MCAERIDFYRLHMRPEHHPEHAFAGGWSPVLAGKREVWELQAVRIYDGGADGDGDTTADNTVFARPGVFVP